MNEPTISSPHNPRIRAAAALRERHARDEAGRFLVDGVREIGRALDGGFEIVETFVRAEPGPGGDPDGARAALLDRLASAGVRLVPLPPHLLARLAFGDRSQGPVAVVAAPRRSLADLPLVEDPLIVVLEGIEKPGNVGAVLRSADGAGVSAVILADPRADPWNPNAIRASLGTVFTVPVRIAAAADTVAWLRARGVGIVAARVDGAREYDRLDYTGPTAIVLGSEAAGLSGAWSSEEVSAVRLPMLGSADSLNVAATAAILCYEALRQRRRRGPP